MITYTNIIFSWQIHLLAQFGYNLVDGSLFMPKNQAA